MGGREGGRKDDEVVGVATFVCVKTYVQSSDGGNFGNAINLMGMEFWGRFKSLYLIAYASRMLHHKICVIVCSIA